MLHTFLYTFIIPHYESKRYIAYFRLQPVLTISFFYPPRISSFHTSILKEEALLSPQSPKGRLQTMIRKVALVQALRFQSPKGRLQTRRELGKSYEEQMDEVSSCYKLFLLYPTSSRKSTCVKDFLLLSTPGGF